VSFQHLKVSYQSHDHQVLSYWWLSVCVLYHA